MAVLRALHGVSCVFSFFYIMFEGGFGGYPGSIWPGTKECNKTPFISPGNYIYQGFEMWVSSLGLPLLVTWY